MTSLDPTSIFRIWGVECCRYLPIGDAWSKSKSCFVDFKGFVALGLEGLGCTIWGALVLVAIYRPTFGSNVISIMSSTTILGGLMSGFTYMFEVFINIYYAFNFKMMIQATGLFASTSSCKQASPSKYGLNKAFT
jgi:hypothetical protein